jgi:ribosomal protein L16 Arg81 hydroxylase
MKFEEMIAPLSRQDFLNGIWGIRSHLERGSTERYSGLVNWADVNRILVEHRWRSPRLRLSKDGAILPVSTYLSPVSDGDGLIRQTDLVRNLRDGATLIIDSVDEIIPSLRDLVRSVERTLCERVQVNLYASWGETKGFDVHWDNHDVFILQVDGRKSWKVYGVSRKYPVGRDRLEKITPPTNPEWEGSLEKGDFLYMPRGCWHLATAAAEPTLHLTFSIPNKTGLDLLAWLGELLAQRSECFRKDLPRFASEAERRRHFLAMRSDLESIFSDGVIDRFLRYRDQIAPTRPELSLPWVVTPGLLPASDEFDIVSLLPRTPQIEVNATEETLSIQALSSVYTFARSTKKVLELIFSMDSITFEELLRQNVGAFTREQLRSLLGRLSLLGLICLRSRI